jgi:hypothetical protein
VIAWASRASSTAQSALNRVCCADLALPAAQLAEIAQGVAVLCLGFGLNSLTKEKRTFINRVDFIGVFSPAISAGLWSSFFAKENTLIDAFFIYTKEQIHEPSQNTNPSGN